MTRLFVDATHCGGRHTTGLERITQELFSPQALAPLAVEWIEARGRRAMMLKQTIGLPALLARHPGSLLITPGFPPSPLATMFGARVLPYIHDLFLMTRWSDLNTRARLYMAGPFRLAVRRLPRFLVNSLTTADELRRFCRPDAEIIPYRPRVADVFGVAPLAHKPRTPGGLRLVALGTVEPRKNFAAAAAILTALRAGPHPDATLDIIGRIGWGVDVDALRRPGVTLRGYLAADEVRALIADADALLCTSHDEGLGLPLLEAQYAGLQVVAPDKPVFREVLGESGVLIDAAEPAQAAARMASALSGNDARSHSATIASANLARWNAVADRDRDIAIALLGRLSGLH